MPITQDRHHATVLAGIRTHATLTNLCQHIERLSTKLADNTISPKEYFIALREATFNARNETLDELRIFEHEQAHYNFTAAKNRSERRRMARRRAKANPTPAPTPRREPTAADFAEALEDIGGVAPIEPEEGQYDEHLSREKLGTTGIAGHKTVEDLDDADIDLRWNEQLGRFVSRTNKEQD